MPINCTDNANSTRDSQQDQADRLCKFTLSLFGFMLTIHTKYGKNHPVLFWNTPYIKQPYMVMARINCTNRSKTGDY